MTTITTTKSTPLSTNLMKPAVFATALVVAMTLTGCDKFKKSDNVHKPAALVKLATSQNVISPCLVKAVIQKLVNALAVCAIKPPSANNLPPFAWHMTTMAM